MQKGICYDNEVFVPPDKQPSDRAATTAMAAHRMSQQAIPLEDELLADMQCLDYGGDHVDSLLQERLCLPRLNTLKRAHGSNQHIKSFEQQESRHMTSSSRTASATLSEGDGAGDEICSLQLSRCCWHTACTHVLDCSVADQIELHIWLTAANQARHATVKPNSKCWCASISILLQLSSPFPIIAGMSELSYHCRHVSSCALW